MGTEYEKRNRRGWQYEMNKSTEERGEEAVID
jgi:hypothetical protein